MPTVKKLSTTKPKVEAMNFLIENAVRNTQKIESAEQGFFNTGEAFRALRSVSFLLFQMDGPGASEWSGEAFSDLRALLELIAEHGVKESDERLDEMTSTRAISA